MPEKLASFNQKKTGESEQRARTTAAKRFTLRDRASRPLVRRA